MPSHGFPPTLNLISLVDLDLDTWYLNFRERIQKDPGKFQGWSVQGNSIFCHIPHKTLLKTNIAECKLVVPKGRRKDVLKYCYDDPFFSHLGFYKTLLSRPVKYVLHKNIQTFPIWSYGKGKTRLFSMVS